MQIASSDHTRYLVGGEPLWEKNVMGFDLSFTPGITTWMVVFWVIMAGMIIAGIIAARKKAMVPKGIQNFAEWCYGSVVGAVSIVIHWAAELRCMVVSWFWLCRHGVWFG